MAVWPGQSSWVSGYVYVPRVGERKKENHAHLGQIRFGGSMHGANVSVVVIPTIYDI